MLGKITHFLAIAIAGWINPSILEEEIVRLVFNIFLNFADKLRYR